MNHEINVTVRVSTETCQSILTTAIEGGINYWECPIRSVVRDADLNVLSFHVKCNDAIDPLYAAAAVVLGDWAVVDEYTVLKGLRNIIADTANVGRRAEIMAQLMEGELDCCDIEDADCILQAGLFGELVYG